MSQRTTTHHTVSFLQLPRAELIRAPEGHSLHVTISVVPDGEERDPLLRDVGRPTWPHRADE